MATLAPEKARLDFRSTSYQRSNYERAAQLKHKTLTDWALSNLDVCAERDIREASMLTLPGEAFDEFCAMLDAPLPDAMKALLEQQDPWDK